MTTDQAGAGEVAAQGVDRAWQFRQATDDDLGSIMDLERATFVTDAWSPKAMRSEVRSEHTYYLVAFHPETPQRVEGYAGLLVPRGASDADIQTIAVAPVARRRGLGRALMRSLMTEARKRGATAVFLEVRADNPSAQALYVSLGFEEIGVRPHYYQPDDVDAIVMRAAIAPARTELATGSGVEPD